jgi:aryl-alcohol dehydrogenase-like predicted oxidoreductase
LATAPPAQPLRIPGTTSVHHLKENLSAARVSLTQDEIDAITALAPEGTERIGRAADHHGATAAFA